MQLMQGEIRPDIPTSNLASKAPLQETKVSKVRRCQLSARRPASHPITGLWFEDVAPTQKRGALQVNFSLITNSSRNQ